MATGDKTNKPNHPTVSIDDITPQAAYNNNKKIVRRYFLPYTVDIFLIAKRICFMKSLIYLCAFIAQYNHQSYLNAILFSQKIRSS